MKSLFRSAVIVFMLSSSTLFSQDKKAECEKLIPGFTETLTAPEVGLKIVEVTGANYTATTNNRILVLQFSKDKSVTFNVGNLATQSKGTELIKGSYSIECDNDGNLIVITTDMPSLKKLKYTAENDPKNNKIKNVNGEKHKYKIELSKDKMHHTFTEGTDKPTKCELLSIKP